MKKMTAILAGILMMAAGSAWATPTLQLFDGSTTVTVADGSALDAVLLSGVVGYNGAVGSGWIVNVATGITKPLSGTAFIPYMDLNSVNLSLTAGSLHVLFSETGFISNTAVTGFTTAVGGTTAGTYEVKSFFDVGNTLFAETGALADLGPYPVGAFSGTETNSAATGDIGNLYSLTLDATITHLANGPKTTSFDVEMTPVPEPGTMMLLGAGFLGLAIYGKRRKNA